MSVQRITKRDLAIMLENIVHECDSFFMPKTAAILMAAADVLDTLHSSDVEE